MYAKHLFSTRIGLAFSLASLALGSLACDVTVNFSETTPTPVPLSTRASEAATPVPTLTPELATSAPTLAPTAPADPLSVLAGKSPCELLTQAQAGEILGEAVTHVSPADDPQTGAKICMFMTGSGKSSIMITVMTEAGAKQSFVNSIAQYQAGCDISFSYDSAATPTALPPEVQALMDKPLVELYQMTRQLQEKCGTTYQAFPEFGPEAYGAYTVLLFPMGSIGIVSEDHYYSFTYIDSASQDEAALLEKARQLTQTILQQ